MNYTADHEALRVALEAAGLFPTKCSLSGHSEKQPDGSMLPVGTVTFTQDATDTDRKTAQTIVDAQSKRDRPTILAARAEIRRLEQVLGIPRWGRDLYAASGTDAALKTRVMKAEFDISKERRKL